MPTRVPLREYNSEEAGRATESREYGAPRTSKRTSATRISSGAKPRTTALTCGERTGAAQLGDRLGLLGQVDGAFDGRGRRGGPDVHVPAEVRVRRPTEGAARCGEQRTGSASGHADAVRSPRSLAHSIVLLKGDVARAGDIDGGVPGRKTPPTAAAAAAAGKATMRARPGGYGAIHHDSTLNTPPSAAARPFAPICCIFGLRCVGYM